MTESRYSISNRYMCEAHHQLPSTRIAPACVSILAKSRVMWGCEADGVWACEIARYVGMQSIAVLSFMNDIKIFYVS
jgi:hypothetical protein